MNKIKFSYSNSSKQILGDFMKNILFVIFASALLLIGCKDNMDSGITGPDVSSQSIEKTPSFITLPARTEGSHSLLKASKMLVTVKDGGKISYKDSYMSISGKIEIDLELEFKKHSVSEDIMVDVYISSETAGGSIGVNFGPSPTTFLIPAKLNMKVSGLDPTSLPENKSDLQLLYTGLGDQENVYEVMKTKEIKMDKHKGSIEVKEGEIPHFSRYQWAKKCF